MPDIDISALREAVDDARNAGWAVAFEAEIKLLAAVPALLDRIEALEGRLREWQLGVGDTEMEARARRAEAVLRGLREWLADGAFIGVPEAVAVLQHLDELEAQR